MTRMKRWMPAVAACLFAGSAMAIGDNQLTAYGTHWNGDKNGYGFGLKYSKSLIDMVYFDGRTGYVAFNDRVDTTVVPIEAGFNLGLPGVITPYAGVGVGYYFIDNPFLDDTAGYFAQAGVEFTLAMFGVMAELRYLDLEEKYLDGVMLNAGLLLSF